MAATGKEPDLTERILERLKCPVCLDPPRKKPIYTCENGHATCPDCISKIKKKCPICRNEVMAPNEFAGYVADETLKDIFASCRFSRHGCLKRQRVEVIHRHEESCVHREVLCASSHRGTCKWIGSLTKLPSHVKEEKCVNILRAELDSNSEIFTNFLADYSESEKTVFNCKIVTHWKPILFIGKVAVKLMIFMTIQRECSGLWIFQFHSYSPDYLLQRIRVKLQIYKSEEKKVDQILSYTGLVISNREKKLDQCKCIILNDAQVKLLQSQEDKILFRYDVRITVLDK